MDWSQLVLKLLMTGIAFLILFSLCVALVIGLHRALSVKHERKHELKLTNRGNFLSLFYLSVTSVEPALSFEFLLNGIPLAAAPPLDDPELEVSEPAFSADPLSAGQPAKSASAGPQKSDQKKPALVPAGAVKGGQAVAAKAGGIASLLGTLGALLPGSMGSGLRSQSAALRETQSNTLSAVQAPVNAQRRVDSLQQESGRMAGVKPAAAPLQAKGSKPAVGSAAPRAQSVHSRLVGPRDVSPVEYLVQTQPLEPGETLSLVLKIGSLKKRAPAGTFAYLVKSQQLPVEKLSGEPVPVLKHGVVNFPRVEIWRYWLAPVTNTLIIATLLFASIFVFRMIWL
jgi:hypothetical protein